MRRSLRQSSGESSRCGTMGSAKRLADPATARSGVNRPFASCHNNVADVQHNCKNATPFAEI